MLVCPLNDSRSVLFVSNSPQELHIVRREHADLSVDLARPPATLVLTRHAHFLSLTQRQFILVLSGEIIQNAREHALRLARGLRRLLDLVHVDRHRQTRSLRAERALRASATERTLRRGFGRRSMERALLRRFPSLRTSTTWTRILLVLFALLIRFLSGRTGFGLTTRPHKVVLHERRVGIVALHNALFGLSIVRLSDLELAHLLSQSGEEHLLHRAERLRLVGEERGSRRFVLIELAD